MFLLNFLQRSIWLSLLSLVINLIPDIYSIAGNRILVKAGLMSNFAPTCDWDTGMSPKMMRVMKQSATRTRLRFIPITIPIVEEIPSSVKPHSQMILDWPDSGLTVVNSCPEKWFKIDGTPGKCIRYFHSSVNFTEAQYICHIIYDGDLLVINSLSEQKQVTQYLHDQLGFNTQPVTWLGGTLTPPNEVQWIDGSPSHYTNFAENLNKIRVDIRKCLKIYSLFSRGSTGAAGQWSEDLCSTRDSGYVCQKPYEAAENRARFKEEMYHDEKPVNNEKLAAKFGEQLKIIKELCESQIKLIETLATNFFENYEHSKKFQAVKLQGT